MARLGSVAAALKAPELRPGLETTMGFFNWAILENVFDFLLAVLKENYKIVCFAGPPRAVQKTAVKYIPWLSRDMCVCVYIHVHIHIVTYGNTCICICKV